MIYREGTAEYINLAKHQFEGRRGQMVILGVRHRGSETDTVEKWFRPGTPCLEILDWLREHEKQRYNIYLCWGLFDTRSRARDHLIATSAFVADWDEAPPKKLRGLEPTVRVETSPGNWQEVFVAREPLEEEEATRTFEAYQRELGCDHCSKDPVHVWRVPGTTNYPNLKKQRAGREPVVAWMRGGINGKVALDLVGIDPSPVAAWPENRTGKSLPWLPRALREEVPVGRRSERFHHLVSKMAEAGWGLRQIEDALRATPVAEKYARRLRGEVERSVEKCGAEPPPPLEPVTKIYYNPQDKEQSIEFMWKPYLPRGEVTMLDGNPGIGKTTLMLRVACDLIQGAKMPNEQMVKGGHKVLYVSHEADYRRVTLPVLKRMGLRHRGYFVHVESSQISLTEEGILQLKQYVQEDKIDLVVIDNLVDYVPPGMNMNDYLESSRLLLRLREVIAVPTNCSIVTLRHNTKETKTNLWKTGMGSVGFFKGVRSALTIVKDEEDEEFMLVNTKNSYHAKGPSLIFEFKAIEDRGVVDWVGTAEKTDERLDAELRGEKEKTSKVDEAAKWLEGILTGKKEGLESDAIYAQGEARGFYRRLVQRASERLGVIKSGRLGQSGGGTLSIWKLTESV